MPKATSKTATTTATTTQNKPANWQQACLNLAQAINDVYEFAEEPDFEIEEMEATLSELCIEITNALRPPNSTTQAEMNYLLPIYVKGWQDLPKVVEV
ncbi:hypothetical protein [Bacteriophage sp.]|nr:hypothetical protein [Bacteriophage sp.]